MLFNPPEWFGKEITQDRRYSNGSLSKNGIPNDYNPEDI
jgi:CYTH domain-containing protein